MERVPCQGYLYTQDRAAEPQPSRSAMGLLLLPSPPHWIQSVSESGLHLAYGVSKQEGSHRPNTGDLSMGACWVWKEPDVQESAWMCLAQEVCTFLGSLLLLQKPDLTLVLFTLPSASQTGSQVSTLFYPSVVNVGVAQLLSVRAYWRRIRPVKSSWSCPQELIFGYRMHEKA